MNHRRGRRDGEGDEEFVIVDRVAVGEGKDLEPRYIFVVDHQLA